MRALEVWQQTGRALSDWQREWGWDGNGAKERPRRVVELVRERRNRDLQVRLVPTLYDQRNAIQKAVLAQLRTELGADVSDTVIGIDTKIREAQAKGIPIGLYAPKARAAEAYAELSREVLTLAWSRAQREAARGEAA